MTDTIHNTILPMTDTTAEAGGLHRGGRAFILRQMPETQRSLFPGGARPFSGVTATRQSATASGQPVRNGKPPRSGAATLKRWNG